MPLNKIHVSRRNLLRTVTGGMLVDAATRHLAAQDPMGPLKIGQATLDVQFHADGFDLAHQEIRAWVASCATAIKKYLGDFPVPQARIEIHASDRARGVSGGRTWGAGGARSRIALGLRSTQEDLNRDWVLTHEMLHYTFPDMPRRHSWIEEGIATYTEPMARAQAGIISTSRVWADMIRDMPQGLPKDGDEGLDNTHTWGRTYWGGAIFCLLADVRIREATNNRKGLPDALRAINRAGGNVTIQWPLARTLEVADHALGISVLRDLHAAMGETSQGKPFVPDLSELWARLGVSVAERGVSLSASAPLASVRRAILADS